MTELEQVRQELIASAPYWRTFDSQLAEFERLVREDERQKLRDTGIERAITHPECW